MKAPFPYWLCHGCRVLWYRIRGTPRVPFEFSEYVLRRHALSAVRRHPDGSVRALFPTETPSAVKALDWLYELLGILDAKASALMRLNGVMLAAAAFLLGPRDGTVHWVRVLVATSAVGSAFSIGLCLLIVSVDWKFLGLVVERGRRELDFTCEFDHLQRVASFRQFFYHSAWWVSFFTTAALLVALIAFFLHEIPG